MHGVVAKSVGLFDEGVCGSTMLPGALFDVTATTLHNGYTMLAE